MRISFLVPTYRRPLDLHRCLLAMAEQTRPADELIVVARPEDIESLEVIAAWRHLPALCLVNVEQTGVVAALNRGLARVSGDIVAITDDDAAPRKDWLERIEAHFLADMGLGGLGGRDWVYERGALLDGKAAQVGKLQWFGRAIGNHHLGFGAVREVDLLKGVNMSYRHEAIRNLRFDHRLLGTGAQVANEMGFSMAVKKAGWRLLYDPAIAVDHFPAPRADEDIRYIFQPLPLSNAAHNETLVILDFLSPPRRAAFLVWGYMVGTRAVPGLLQALRRVAEGDRQAFGCLRAAFAGRTLGFRTWMLGGRQPPGL